MYKECGDSDLEHLWFRARFTTYQSCSVEDVVKTYVVVRSLAVDCLLITVLGWSTKASAVGEV